MKKAWLLGLPALLAIPFGPATGRASTPSLIVFSADRAPTVTGEIYRLDPNGHRIDLSRSPYQDTGPAVSSDGKRVAFVSDRGGKTAVYVVGSNGRGLLRIGPSLHPLPDAGCIPQLAWQPRGAVLAVGACSLDSGSLWIVDRGRKPLKLLQGKNGIQGTSWSPDGRVLVASTSPGAVHAFSAAGHPLWRVNGGCCGTWSPQGLFAVAANHGAGVYDEAGRLRFELRLPTRAARFSWSPDGRYVAVSWSGNATWLEVLTAAGTREFTRRVPGGNLAWAGNSTVVLGYPQCPACGKTVGFDARTGKESRASNRWLDPLSTDRKLAIVTPPTKNGTPFELGVAPPSSGALKAYTRIGGCYGDGVWMPAITSPQFSGRSLVYQSWGECDEPYANLYSVGPDGSGLRRLTNAQAQETQPAISPDGSEIAYVWADANGLSCKGCSDGIRVASANGAELRTLTNPEDCTFDDSPTWSPDGSTILYTESNCDEPPGPELYTVPASGGPAHDLGIVGTAPAWGPSRIAYIGLRTDQGLWTANPDGSDPTKVATNGKSPAWSPDGRLAYLLGSGGRTVVVGSTETTLPFELVESLAWSPDGTRFVVVARKQHAAAYDVYTVKTDGTDPIELTQDYDASGASWR